GQPLAATGAGGGELGGGADEGLVAARHLPAAGGPAGQEAGVPGGGPPAAADRLHRAEHRPALRGAGGGLLSAGGQGPAEGAAPSTPATVGLSGHGHGTGRLTQDSYFRGRFLFSWENAESAEKRQRELFTIFVFSLRSPRSLW